MSVFKKLFQKQAGGSIVGNILRGVGDKFTGGAYSQIFTKPKGKGDAPDVQQVVNTITAAAAKLPGGAASNTGTGTPPIDAGGEKPGFMDTVKKYWYYFAGGAAALIGGIWYFTTRGHSGRGRRR